jgi:hypothetical protein
LSNIAATIRHELALNETFLMSLYLTVIVPSRLANGVDADPLALYDKR